MNLYNTSQTIDVDSKESITLKENTNLITHFYVRALSNQIGARKFIILWIIFSSKKIDYVSHENVFAANEPAWALAADIW